MRITYLSKRMLLLSVSLATMFGLGAPAADAQRSRPTLHYPCCPQTQNPCCPAVPGAAITPGDPSAVIPPTGGDPSAVTPAPMDPGFDPGMSIAGLGANAPVPGYINSAIPFNQIRLRYDAAFNNIRPDRAEFFYAKCGCFGTPDANGPPKVESSIDYQDLRTYMEGKVTETTSLFLDIPVRWLNPEMNDNTSGLANIIAGFKQALIYTPEQVFSFQFWVEFPTGDSDRGLGNNLYSLEPSLLYHRQLSQRLFLDTQLGIWIPINGSDFAGEILNYGLALSLIVFESPTSGLRIAPVAEVLGWTVMDGAALSLTGGGTEPAAGQTIVNGKIGVRVGLGSLGLTDSGSTDFYIGYGRSLTGDFWYNDIVRFEFRTIF